MSARYDYTRRERIGLSEAVLCEGKDPDALLALTTELAGKSDHPVLFTRFLQDQFNALPASLRDRFDYDRLSRTAFLNGCFAKIDARVSVVTAGTSDLSVAGEACRTLEFIGISPHLIADVGVAGLWRLMERVDDLKESDTVIVIAGMDAALVSVVAGLVAQPIIGVPTSTGYGVATGGRTALNAMLASCAQGLLVTNIDNGFGAACAAARIINWMKAA
jgi:NCAIR mutase (PurE)-related protein